MEIDSLCHIKEDCNGCGACVYECGCHAVSMKEDEEGFLYPFIDERKCIDCHKCELSCPQKHPCTPLSDNTTAFGLKLHNKSILANSTSGGAFSALCRVFFELYPEGVVYGCILTVNSDHSFEAKHIRATNFKECEGFRGSKYIQSVFWPVYEEIESDLKNDRHVLCVGTPCQIAGLSRCFSHNNRSLLFLVDILCHSVPSPLMFNEHIRALERKSRKTIERYRFRPKTKGWRHFEEAYDSSGNIIFQNNRDTQRHKELFYAELISRPSCSQCQYAGMNSVSDITIGDFWGAEKVVPGFMDRQGVSLVLIHNQRGSVLFAPVASYCDIITVDPNIALSNNHTQASSMNPKRELFWKKYRMSGYESASRQFLDSSLLWHLKKIVRIFLSDQTRGTIRRILHV